jgi:type IV secretory pathway TrbL component
MNDLVERLVSYSSWIGGAGFLLVWIGVTFRRRRRVHVPIMASACVIDIANVLIIELGRGAVEKSLSTATTARDWVLKLHILVSVTCIVCYAIAIVTGTRLLRRGAGRAVHRRNAAVFLVCRTVNFITSFWV